MYKRQAMVICLSLRYPLMIAVFVLFALKEIVLGIVGLALLKKKHRRLDGAMWCGKICTFILYMAMFVLFLFPQIPAPAAVIMILICGELLIYAFLHYLSVYRRMWRVEDVPHTAVSYTHLDVYKRQSQGYAGPDFQAGLFP